MFDNEATRLLMIPGPTPVDPRIRDAIARPTISHTSAALAEIIRRSQAGLRTVAGGTSARAFIFGGSGTLAQEAAVINLVPQGGRLLVVSNGYFGDRFAAIAVAHGIEAAVLHSEPGDAIPAEAVEDALRHSSFDAVTLTHVDTSTGVAAPVREIAAVTNAARMPLILDSVCALGGMPVDMDSLGIDIVLTGAQKALGVPPGLAILLVSERAMERRRALSSVHSCYADLLNWEASMADPQVYFSTHAVNLFYGLDAALDIVQSEGLTARFARHEELAQTFRQGMHGLGFEPLTAPARLAPTLSVLAYPGGVDDAAYRSSLAEGGIIAAACLGGFKGRGLRFGHMGNIGQAEIERALDAAQWALERVSSAAPTGD
jgi:alanine-glyoxylate transaminase / serine-glyoxylate transaminase / serine-pyruvate transaminase